MSAKNIKLYIVLFALIFVWIVGWNSAVADTDYRPTPTCSWTATPTQEAYQYRFPVVFSRECIETEWNCSAGGVCRMECVR
jgi:hypothetical protein